MLSWLWRWKLSPARPEAAAAEGARARDIGAHSQVRELAHQLEPSLPSEPSFFDQLAREQPPLPPVPAEDEPLISALVMLIVDHVTQKKVDPPVVPALVPRVLAIVGEPEVDLQRLTHVIQQDQAISAKLLSVANSPLFGGQVEVRTVRQAIAHLGTEQVAQVAIGLACKSNLEGSTSQFAARWQQQFQHAMTCAFAAASYAGKLDPAAQEAAFLGGLFHDVGQAVGLRALEALLRVGRTSVPSEQVLDEALHRLHAYPGDEFYDKWTLPEALMSLCARHHQLDDLDPQDKTFWQVNLASSFDSLLSGTPAARRDAQREARISADKLGLSEPALRVAHAEARTLGARTARMFTSS